MGKSTLIQLIPRFCDVSEGEILIDGVNVKEYKLSALRNKIGYIPKALLLLVQLLIIFATVRKMRH